MSCGCCYARLWVSSPSDLYGQLRDSPVQWVKHEATAPRAKFATDLLRVLLQVSSPFFQFCFPFVYVVSSLFFVLEKGTVWKGLSEGAALTFLRSFC